MTQLPLSAPAIVGPFTTPNTPSVSHLFYITSLVITPLANQSNVTLFPNITLSHFCQNYFENLAKIECSICGTVGENGLKQDGFESVISSQTSNTLGKRIKVMDWFHCMTEPSKLKTWLVVTGWLVYKTISYSLMSSSSKLLSFVACKLWIMKHWQWLISPDILWPNYLYYFYADVSKCGCSKWWIDDPEIQLIKFITCFEWVFMFYNVVCSWYLFALKLCLIYLGQLMCWPYSFIIVLKFTKIYFCWGFAPGLTGGIHAVLDPHAPILSTSSSGKESAASTSQLNNQYSNETSGLSTFSHAAIGAV